MSQPLPGEKRPIDEAKPTRQARNEDNLLTGKQLACRKQLSPDHGGIELAGGAEQHGMTERTIWRDGERAEFIEKLAKVAPDEAAAEQRNRDSEQGAVLRTRGVQ